MSSTDMPSRRASFTSSRGMRISAAPASAARSTDGARPGLRWHGYVPPGCSHAWTSSCAMVYRCLVEQSASLTQMRMEPWPPPGWVRSMPARARGSSQRTTWAPCWRAQMLEVAERMEPVGFGRPHDAVDDGAGPCAPPGCWRRASSSPMTKHIPIPSATCSSGATTNWRWPPCWSSSGGRLISSTLIGYIDPPFAVGADFTVQVQPEKARSVTSRSCIAPCCGLVEPHEELGILLQYGVGNPLGHRDDGGVVSLLPRFAEPRAHRL